MISGTTLAKYLSNILHELQSIQKAKAESKKEKNSSNVKSWMLRDTMSMTHSKTHSKDSSYHLLKPNESNFQNQDVQDEYFDSQWTVNLFNHKVYLVRIMVYHYMI